MTYNDIINRAVEKRTGLPAPSFQQQNQQYEQEQEWDYRTAERGPNNEEMPNGAEGFDPYGRPYYGDGISGWWNGLVHRMSAPVQDAPGLSEIKFDFGKNEWQRTAEMFTSWDGIKSAFGETVRDVAGAIDIVGQNLGEMGREEGEYPNIFNFIGRGAKEAIGGVFKLFEVSAKGVEKYWGGTALALEEMAGEDSPNLLPDDILPNTEIENKLVEIIRSMNPIGMGINAVRAYQNTTGDEREKIWDDNLIAGNIAYTAFTDPAVKEEYIRRVRAGESPTLLMMELEDIGSEIIGQMIFDPLNLLALSGKTAVQGGRVSNATDLFLTAADPEVAKLLKLVETADDAKAAQYIQDFAQARVASLSKRGKTVAEYADARGLWALTTQGKRSTVARNANAIIERLVRDLAGNKDELLEAMRGLVMSVSDNVDEVAEGLATLQRAPSANTMFSRAGEEAGVLLRTLITDADGTLNPAKFLDDLAAKSGDIDKLIEWSEGKIANATEKLFPTILEKIKRGDNVPTIQKALARIDEVAQNKIYRGANQFFANIYMGYNPGFAFRNALTNSVHVFADQGMRAGWQATIAQVKEMVSPGSIENIHDDVKYMLGGAVPETLDMGFSLGKSAGVKNVAPTMKWSERAEKGASAVVVRHTVQETMSKSLPHVLDADALRVAGYTEEKIGLIQSLIVDNWGNVDEVEKMLLNAGETGGIAVGRTTMFIPKEDAKLFRQTFTSSPIQKAIRESETLEEALARIDDIVSNVFSKADEVSKEIPALDIDNLSGGWRDVIEFGEAVSNGYGSPAKSALGHARYSMNTLVQNRAEEIFREVFAEVSSKLASSGGDTTEIAQRFNDVMKEMATVRGAANSVGRNLPDAFWKMTDEIKALPSGSNWASLWRKYKIPGNPPYALTKETLLNNLWDVKYFEQGGEYWRNVRDTYVSGLRAEIGKFIEVGGEVSPEVARMVHELDSQWMTAKKFDNAIYLDGYYYVDAGTHASYEAVTKMGKAYGIENPPYLLNAINANLPEDAEKYGRLLDVPADVAREALEARETAKAIEEGRKANIVDIVVPEIPEGTRFVENIVAPAEGISITPARAIYENKDGITKAFDRLKDGITANWGRVDDIKSTEEQQKVLSGVLDTARRRVSEARLIAQNVADQARQFTLLDYTKKRNIDLALAYVYPYSFWHTRTYKNWMTQRVMTSPDIIAGYAKYRSAMEKQHADMPDWWKYQINTNELLGMDAENPLFFNLEATINPLNGLVGVDFNDPEKRTGWLTAMLDDAGKIGPSTWTPFSYAAALALYMKGETEAAARWGGRLFPQTQTIKSLANILGLDLPFHGEFDPAVHFFSGGMDVYERKRVARALAAMVEDGTYTEAEIQDAAYYQDGPIWDEAAERAIGFRAPGNLSSFFLGVGFKGRSPEDLEIDRFYADYFGLMRMRPNLSSEEFQNEMEGMRTQYPFMNAVLLSRRTGEERDTGLAYDVFARVPPAQLRDIAELMGMDSRLIDNFYSDKGKMTEWKASDHERFMAGVVDIAAVVDIPDGATRMEWREAKNAYSALFSSGEKLFGDDIWQKVDAFYATEDKDASYEYLELHPEVEEALDWKTQIVLRNPLLSAYYGSIETIERYYTNQMYDEIEAELGADIWAQWDEYHYLKDTGQSTRAYWNTHPELARYGEIRDEWSKTIASKVIALGSKLPEGKPAFMRPDADFTSLGSQDLQSYFDQPPAMIPWETWQEVLPQSIQKGIATERLTEADAMQLERISEMLGLETAQLIDMVLAVIP